MYRAPQISPEDRPPTRWNDARPLPQMPVAPRPPRRWAWRLLKYGFVLAIWMIVLGSLGLVYFAWDLPRPEAALDRRRKPSLTLQDNADRIIAAFGDVVGDRPSGDLDRTRCVRA